MHGSTGDVAIEVLFDERLFLAVPIELRGPSADGANWAREPIETLQVQPDRVADLDGVITQLAGQASLLSPEAFAAFLFCPSGLPGSALVEIFIARTELTSLADVTVSYPVALPQREHPIPVPRADRRRALLLTGSNLVAADAGQEDPARVAAQSLYDAIALTMVWPDQEA